MRSEGALPRPVDPEAAPLLVLYELGVLLARLAGRKRTRSEAIVPFSEPD